MKWIPCATCLKIAVHYVAVPHHKILDWQVILMEVWLDNHLWDYVLIIYISIYLPNHFHKWYHQVKFLYHNLEKFDWKKTDDIGGYVSRYPGEWYVVDCQLQDGTTKVSLWKGDKDKKNKVVVDQQNVKDQTFNITNLTSKDGGDYYCKAQYRKDKFLGHLYVKLGMCTH